MGETDYIAFIVFSRNTKIMKNLPISALIPGPKKEVNLACRKICARHQYSNNLTYLILPLQILDKKTRCVSSCNSLAIQNSTPQQTI